MLFRCVKIGFCLFRGTDGAGEEVTKPYTPTTLDSDVGYFELVIKVNYQFKLIFYFESK